MKECPNCGALLSDSADECMSCNYNFAMNKIISQETMRVEEETRRREEDQKRRNEVAFERQKHQKLVTTGYNFEGYNIISYNGVMSGSVVVGTGIFSEFAAGISDMFGTKSKEFSDKLEYARSTALKRLIERSESAGGNAIIGVDFDYVTFANNMIGVVASGTSVFVEKIRD